MSTLDGLLSPWVLAIGLGIGLIGSIKPLRQILSGQASNTVFGHSLSNTEITSLPTSLEVVANDDGEPIPLLSGEPLRSAVENLVEYCRRFQPDSLLGVHLSGRLLSAYVAKQLNMRPDQCCYVATLDGLAGGFEIDDLPRVYGRTIVIDDIARSGMTLLAFRAYLQTLIEEKTIDLTRVAFATLVQSPETYQDRNSSIVDWSAYKSNSIKCVFPWTVDLMAIRHAFEMKQKGVYLEHYLEMYRSIRGNYDFALNFFLEKSRIENFRLPGNSSPAAISIVKTQKS